MALINYVISPLSYSSIQLLYVYFHRKDSTLKCEPLTISGQLKATLAMCGIGIIEAMMLSFADSIFENSRLGRFCGIVTGALVSSAIAINLKNEENKKTENFIFLLGVGMMAGSFGRVAGSGLDLLFNTKALKMV